MRTPARRALGIVVAGMAVISLAAPTMAAAPATDRGSGGHVSRLYNHPGPLTERQNARRKAAQELILSGKASPDEDGVVKPGEDKYIQAAVTGTGQAVHDPVGVRRPGERASSARSARSTTDRQAQPRSRHRSLDPRCRTTTARTGRRTSTTAVLPGPVLRRRRVVRGLLHEAVVGRLHGRRRVGIRAMGTTG